MAELISERAAALADLTVLDLSHHIAGPFGARLLGDLGADVIKVEQPKTGDLGRRLQPLVAGGPPNEQSLLFQYLNWNKRGITLDLRRPEARPVLERLVHAADVVIEAFEPGTIESWGIGPEQLFSWNPSLVLTSVSNFGQTGPYAAYKASDLVFYAISGLSQISGTVDREPLKHGLQQSLYCAGLNVPYATLAALRTVARSGEAQHVDLSIHECLVSELVMNVPYYALSGIVQGRRQSEQFPLSGEPIKARNGYVTLQAVAGRNPYELYAELFQKPELLDPAFNVPGGRVESDLADWLRFIFEEAVSEWDARELFLAVENGRQLAGFVQDAEELLECPQLAAREFWVQPGHPATGAFKFPGETARLSETPFAVRRPAPLLGEHTDVVLAEIGFNSNEIEELREQGIV